MIALVTVTHGAPAASVDPSKGMGRSRIRCSPFSRDQLSKAVPSHIVCRHSQRRIAKELCWRVARLRRTTIHHPLDSTHCKSEAGKGSAAQQIQEQPNLAKADEIRNGLQ